MHFLTFFMFKNTIFTVFKKWQKLNFCTQSISLNLPKVPIGGLKNNNYLLKLHFFSLLCAAAVAVLRHVPFDGFKMPTSSSALTKEFKKRI